MSVSKEHRCACYLCSLTQSQERTWIFNKQFSSALQLLAQRARERERDGGREEGGGERRKVPHKPRPIYLPLFSQRQQLELICDSFSCLTETPREPQSLCTEEQMIRKTSFFQFICFELKFKQKLNLKTKPLQLMYNLRF